MIARERPYHNNFGHGRHQLGSRLIDPNRIAQYVPRVTFTLDRIAEAAKTFPNIGHLKRLKQSDIILVASPERSLSFDEVARLCPTDNPTLQVFAARLKAACNVDLKTDSDAWLTANRSLTTEQLRRQNAAALLWAELAQFYGRDGLYPLYVH